MKTGDLAGPLLASVSRSFFLTIRILPRELRAPIGLAYLLARASDTIADTAVAPAPVRLQFLRAFATMIRTGSRDEIGALQREIRPPSAGEAQLIMALPRCLDWLARQTEPDRAEIIAVLEKIIHGQSLDLQRFATPEVIVALRDATELEEYTYLVAGCVGEFWTRICRLHLPRYSSLAEEELERLGKSYGQGLQLVNILRDAPADLRAGRCYLPATELAAAQLTPASLSENPLAARPIFERWQTRAGRQLADGLLYLRSLRPARLRIGCFLPWFLGAETLRLLREHPPLETPTRVKVPRSTVRRALFRSLAIACSDAALDRIAATFGESSSAASR